MAKYWTDTIAIWSHWVGPLELCGSFIAHHSVAHGSNPKYSIFAQKKNASPEKAVYTFVSFIIHL